MNMKKPYNAIMISIHKQLPGVGVPENWHSKVTDSASFVLISFISWTKVGIAWVTEKLKKCYFFIGI